MNRLIVLVFTYFSVSLLPGAALAQNELAELEIERISNRGEFAPDADKAYLMIESRNSRPLIRFVRAGEGEKTASIDGATGYIEIPRDKRYVDGGDVSVWLFAVPVGDYFVSTITWQWTAFDLDCACMGSVRFPVERGKVTAIRLETALLDASGRQVAIGNRPPRELRRPGENDLFAMRGIAVGHPTSGLWRDRLSDRFVEPARFMPVAELPNWFGGMVSRVMPIDGVLDYERDQIVDPLATP